MGGKRAAPSGPGGEGSAPPKRAKPGGSLQHGDGLGDNAGAGAGRQEQPAPIVAIAGAKAPPSANDAVNASFEEIDVDDEDIDWAKEDEEEDEEDEDEEEEEEEEEDEDEEDEEEDEEDEEEEEDEERAVGKRRNKKALNKAEDTWVENKLQALDPGGGPDSTCAKALRDYAAFMKTTYLSCVKMDARPKFKHRPDQLKLSQAAVRFPQLADCCYPQLKLTDGGGPVYPVVISDHYDDEPLPLSSASPDRIENLTHGAAIAKGAIVLTEIGTNKMLGDTVEMYEDLAGWDELALLVGDARGRAHIKEQYDRTKKGVNPIAKIMRETPGLEATLMHLIYKAVLKACNNDVKQGRRPEGQGIPDEELRSIVWKLYDAYLEEPDGFVDPLAPNGMAVIIAHRCGVKGSRLPGNLLQITPERRDPAGRHDVDNVGLACVGLNALKDLRKKDEGKERIERTCRGHLKRRIEGADERLVKRLKIGQPSDQRFILRPHDGVGICANVETPESVQGRCDHVLAKVEERSRAGLERYDKYATVTGEVERKRPLSVALRVEWCRCPHSRWCVRVTGLDRVDDTEEWRFLGHDKKHCLNLARTPASFEEFADAQWEYVHCVKCETHRELRDPDSESKRREGARGFCQPCYQNLLNNEARVAAAQWFDAHGPRRDPKSEASREEKIEARVKVFEELAEKHDHEFVASEIAEQCPHKVEPEDELRPFESTVFLRKLMALQAAARGYPDAKTAVLSMLGFVDPVPSSVPAQLLKAKAEFHEDNVDGAVVEVSKKVTVEFYDPDINKVRHARKGCPPLVKKLTEFMNAALSEHQLGAVNFKIDIASFMSGALSFGPVAPGTGGTAEKVPDHVPDRHDVLYAAGRAKVDSDGLFTMCDEMIDLVFSANKRILDNVKLDVPGVEASLPTFDVVEYGDTTKQVIATSDELTSDRHLPFDVIVHVWVSLWKEYVWPITSQTRGIVGAHGGESLKKTKQVNLKQVAQRAYRYLRTRDAAIAEAKTAVERKLNQTAGPSSKRRRTVQVVKLL
ncbi:unnamed protein product [Pedinophyceae sp. YPF-701]|nr:unnamed protein product [Pedinophyceae sp. YPF-701]